jgi:hypothetical protein
VPCERPSLVARDIMLQVPQPCQPRQAEARDSRCAPAVILQMTRGCGIFVEDR